MNWQEIFPDGGVPREGCALIGRVFFSPVASGAALVVVFSAQLEGSPPPSRRSEPFLP